MTRRDTLKLFGLFGLRVVLPAKLAAAEPTKPAYVYTVLFLFVDFALVPRFFALNHGESSPG